ncbi:MAG: methylated-DNA--[protein]-cysteine S-methyltransferase [Magnetospirillum sp.]|nr:methylated-DNA--[protein]-cysteine S-methyltransferase [Magnetospirillum sp.]
MTQLAYNSPVGPLAIAEEDGRIVSVDWGWPAAAEETPLLVAARDQLEEYFAGRRTAFDLPLDPPGTDFQRRVWSALTEIPFGETATYGALATRLGTSARAIGGACGRNPIPVLIPCHRVVAAGGELGGYSGFDGIDTKRFLLRHEGAGDAGSQ